MASKTAKQRHLDQAFNLTLSDWEKIFDHQGRVCYICERPIVPPRKPHTDHCHKTGLIRGILCSQCNRALGKVEDPRWQWTFIQLLRGSLYLQRPPATEALGGPRYGFPGKIGTLRYKKWLKNKGVSIRTESDG